MTGPSKIHSVTTNQTGQWQIQQNSQVPWKHSEVTASRKKTIVMVHGWAYIVFSSNHEVVSSRVLLAGETVTLLPKTRYAIVFGPASEYVSIDYVGLEKTDGSQADLSEAVHTAEAVMRNNAEWFIVRR